MGRGCGADGCRRHSRRSLPCKDIPTPLLAPHKAPPLLTLILGLPSVPRQALKEKGTPSHPDLQS